MHKTCLPEEQTGESWTRPRAVLPAPGCTRYMNTSEQLPSLPGLLETSRSDKRTERDLLSLLFPSALQQVPSLLAGLLGKPSWKEAYHRYR